MKSVFYVFCAMMFAMASAAHAEHCWNKTRIMHAAHAMDETSEHFHQLIHDLEGFSHLANDAHRLADKARHLHQVTESGYDCDHIRHDFHEVSHAFEHLKKELRRAHEIHHNPHVMYDFEHVEMAYNGLHREIHAPRPVTTYVTCGSHNYRPAVCYAGGTIVSASVYRQHSSARCTLGYSWGYLGSNIYVMRGCRATFLVSIIPSDDHHH